MTSNNNTQKIIFTFKKNIIIINNDAIFLKGYHNYNLMGID